MEWWIGSAVYRRPQAQWEPTLTAHDDSAVITINDPPAGSSNMPTLMLSYSQRRKK